MTKIFSLLAVLALLGLAYWVFIGRKNQGRVGSNGENGGSGNGSDPSNPNAGGQPAPDPIGKGSILVQSSDIVVAQNPASFFNPLTITEANAASYNIVKKQTVPSPRIHYVVGNVTANASCSPFVWYKNALYALFGTEVDGSGIRTCYYRFNPAVLPNTLRIQTPFSANPTCSAFRYYQSGVEYKFDTMVTVSPQFSSAPATYYCVYNKQ